MVLAGREALDMEHVADLAAAIRSFDRDDQIDRLADDFAHGLLTGFGRELLETAQRRDGPCSRP